MALLTPFIRNDRTKRVLPYVHGDVLDVGCDHAMLFEVAGERMASYTGIELSPQRVAILSRRYPQASFMQRNLEEDALDLGKRFDVIVLMAVIEHIHNQDHLTRELAKALKPSGRILITTPTPFGNGVVHRLGAILGIFNRAAMHTHVAIYTRERFIRQAERFGLRVVQYRRFQLGCNQLVVLERASGGGAGGRPEGRAHAI